MNGADLSTALLFGPRPARAKPPAPTPHGVHEELLTAHPELSGMLEAITTMHDHLTRLQSRRYNPGQDERRDHLLDHLSLQYEVASATAGSAAEALVELHALTEEQLIKHPSPGIRARQLVSEIDNAQKMYTEARRDHNRSTQMFGRYVRQLLQLKGEIIFLNPADDPGTALPERSQAALTEMTNALDNDWPQQYQDRDDYTALMIAGARKLIQAEQLGQQLQTLVDRERAEAFARECGDKGKQHGPNIARRLQEREQLVIKVNDLAVAMSDLPDAAINPTGFVSTISGKRLDVNGHLVETLVEIV
jgi:hypothetical protein